MRIRKILNWIAHQSPSAVSKTKSEKTYSGSKVIAEQKQPAESQPLDKGRVNRKDKDDFKEISEIITSIFGDKDQDLPLKDRAFRFTNAFIEIQRLIKELPSKSDKRKAASEINILSRKIESIGPKHIQETLERIREIKYLHSKLSMHSSDETVNAEMDELEGERIGLEDSLIASFRLFAEIRTLLAENTAKLDDRSLSSLQTGHAYLSRAMGQTSNSPEDVVVFPTLKVSRLATARMIITQKKTRKQIKEAMGFLVKGLTKASKHAFQRLILGRVDVEKAAETFGKAKVAAVNSLAGLGIVLSGPLFGRDLKAASRNVVKTRDTSTDADIIMQKLLEQDMKKGKSEVAKEGAVKQSKVAKHITDGVCAGFSLELAIQVLRNSRDVADQSKYLTYAAGFAQGAPAQAHAHQAIYEGAESRGVDLSYFEELMEGQQKHALDPVKGKGIYQANYNNVKECYDGLLKNRPLGNSPLAKAVHDVRESVSGDYVQSNAEFYIKNTEIFKNKVLEKLKEIESPEERQLAENELEWLMGNLEMRFVFRYISKLIPIPPTTGVGVAKSTPSLEAVLEMVSNPEIRKNLDYMNGVENDFYRQNSVALARGVKFERMESILGFSFGMKNDSEMLDSMNNLSTEEGLYILSIDLKEGAHAMQFYKKGDVQYLFDPNFGVIDCSGGRHKEQITKLLAGLALTYPSTTNLGSNGDGTGHNISLVRVVNVDVEKDPLHKVKVKNFTLDNEGHLIAKSAAHQEMDKLNPIEINLELRKQLLQHASDDEKKVAKFVKELNSYAVHGALGKQHTIEVKMDGKMEKASYSKEEQRRFVFQVLDLDQGSPLGKALLKAMKAMEKKG